MQLQPQDFYLIPNLSKGVMKASEVVNKYAQGERNFQGANLRGLSFKGKNLSGADFSNADIRGTNFTGANLTGTNFRGAKAGLQKRWAAFLVTMAFVLAVISGFCAAFAGLFVAALFDEPGSEYAIARWVCVVSIIFFFALIIRQGFSGALAVAFTVVLAVVFTVVFTVAFTVVSADSTLSDSAIPIAIALAIVIILFSAYLSWRSLKGDPRDIWLRTMSITIAATGGTNFYQANLTDADFTGAVLKSTDMRKAILIRTCWRGVEKLDRVRPGNSYLKSLSLQQWLVGKGTEKNFDKQDLRGVNLQGANLTEASFIGADLCEANLQNADLSKAKLVQTQLDQTNLTGATLTGAYIEEWNITTDTKLDGITCDYIYMRLPPEKRPDWLKLPPEDSLNDNPRRKPENWNRNFAPGEFADFIAPMVETLDLYHNQTVDPQLVAIAYHQLKEDNPDAQLELVSVEKKGKNKDKLLLRSETTPQADHGALSTDYFSNLEYLKSLPPEAQQALLIERGFMLNQIITPGLLAPGQQNHFSINNPTNNNQNTTENHRNINTDGGNYNENIEGNYIQENKNDQKKS